MKTRKGWVLSFDSLFHPDAIALGIAGGLSTVSISFWVSISLLVWTGMIELKLEG
jgi:hypothetical protein